MDIVGLWLPEKPEKLSEALAYLNEKRLSRNQDIVEKLRGLGLDISYDDVAAKAGGTVGRPHIAQVLVDKGYIPTMQDAFDRYIGTGGKAHVPKTVLTPIKALELLKAEGATVILAHPHMYSKVTPQQMEAFLVEHKPRGLDGLEAYYSEYSEADTQHYLGLAERLKLAVSGGSDYHGTVKPAIQLGVGKGTLRVPYAVLAELKALRKRQGLPNR